LLAAAFTIAWSSPSHAFKPGLRSSATPVVAH